MKKSLHKKTVILDSSVWISYFTEEEIFHYQSVKLVHQLFKKQRLIFMPEIIYFEILNVLLRSGYSTSQIENIKKLLLDKCHLIKSNFEEISKMIEKIGKKANLKTQDLIILIHCVTLPIIEFYCHDQKLLNTYSKLYERSSH